MPEAACNYSIMELEMCGLAIDIASFVHLLRKVDFDAVVDHLAIMHIMRSKVEPATTRIKRLLEVLSSYSFNLYYIKTDIDENLPFQENIILEIYERPDKSYFQEPTELKDLVDTRNIIQ